MTTSTLTDPAAADLAALKTRQQATWSSGDYAAVGTMLQIVGETLCEAVDLRAGERVLDVAAGNGNASLAAARRFGVVTSTDYVPALLEKARARAAADGLPMRFEVADAEALPFPDACFDVTLSTFGVMFTANHRAAVSELLRVTRPGGRVGLANWTPGGFIGRLFAAISRHVPPPPAARSPALWGTRAWIDAEFAAGARTIAATPRVFAFRFRSPEHFVDHMRTWYGPMLKAFAAVGAEGRDALEADILALVGEFNTAEDGTAVIPSEYLEVVVTKG